MCGVSKVVSLVGTTIATAGAGRQHANEGRRRTKDAKDDGEGGQRRGTPTRIFAHVRAAAHLRFVSKAFAVSGSPASRPVGLAPGLHGVEDGPQRQSFPRE